MVLARKLVLAPISRKALSIVISRGQGSHV
jgi:hypothetical protein